MKLLLRYKYLGLLIFPLVILFLSWQEADTRFSRDLSVFFPEESLSKKERFIFFLFSQEKEMQLTQREQKDLAMAIVRSAQRLELPDDTKLGGLRPNIELFLYIWAKVRTKHESLISSNSGFGILGLSDAKVKELEKRTNASIDRKFDIYNYNIQYKIAIILFKELLAKGLSAKEAYLELFELKGNPSEWDKLESLYAELHKKAIPEQN